MGLFDLLRGDNNNAKRALVNKWLDGVEPHDPEPSSPISTGSADFSNNQHPPNPVRVYKPPSPPLAMRRFDNFSIAQWEDPFTSTLRTQSITYQPYSMGSGLAYESGPDYKRVLVPYEESDSEEDESEDDDETSDPAGKTWFDHFHWISADINPISREQPGYGTKRARHSSKFPYRSDAWCSSFLNSAAPSADSRWRTAPSTTTNASAFRSRTFT